MADRVGQQLGNYRLVQLLGRGGFAEVYLGEHQRLGTQAAIKVLHTQLADEDVGGFLKEAQTIARLEHPHIVRVLDFDVQQGTPFLVMSYASNGTLRQRHPKGEKLPLATIVGYVKQVADALQTAHDEKLIHRDIKPENMLLGRRNEILLSDFGIALVAQSSRYQNTQEVAGTVAYMAPEQIQGKPRPASDQYSLGVVVYEWLTGERPFHGSFTEIATQHVLVPPPPLREKDPAIVPDVEQVVITALAKDAKGRFGSVQAFANALEQAGHSRQTPELAPTIIVKPPALVIPAPHMTVPSSSPIEAPVTPPLPPTQFAAPSKSVGTMLYTYRGHSGRVNAVAWSPDSKKIASGGDDKTVQVWEAITGDKAIICSGHSKQVNAVAWSPNGQRIVSGSSDGAMQVWDATGNKIVTYRGHAKGVNAAAWSPNGQAVASGGDDKEVHIWDAAMGIKTIVYRGYSSSLTVVAAIAWLPNGMFIASAGNDSEVQVWNTAVGRRVFSYLNHSNWVNTLACSPDGNYIASGSDDRTVQVWNATSGRNIYTCRGHAGKVFAVTWSPDGRYIASGSWDGTVQIWSTATGSNTYTYRGHASKVGAVRWSPNGKYVASGSWDGTVHIWVAP